MPHDQERHELALMRLASQVTLAAYEAVYRALRDGMTQRDVGNLIERRTRSWDFRGIASVEVGEFSAFPHGSTTPQVIREADRLIDGGCTVEGYESDITRTFVLGKASGQDEEVFDVVHRAQSAALAAARPGAECGSVDAAARKVIDDAGYGPDYKFFAHRLGHGMGMDGHEWPYLVRGNTTKLQANMTFSDEPGIYIRGEFGIRLKTICTSRKMARSCSRHRVRRWKIRSESVSFHPRGHGGSRRESGTVFLRVPSCPLCLKLLVLGPGSF